MSKFNLFIYLYLFNHTQALNYCKIKSGTITPCYGITKFPDSDGNYAMVLSRHSEGNLRDYLQNNHSKLTLKDRIVIFKDLCDSLDDIHKKDLIHCDLHSGNLLIEWGACFITDLGLCGPVDEESSGKIYGIIPYIAPEVLQGKKNTKQSDVYSVGMLMWEIFAGRPPFDDRPHSDHLILDIYKGLRPQILPSIPDDYAQMMKKCWDTDPSKRPTIKELLNFARNKLKEIYENENLEIDPNENNDSGDNNNGSSNSQQTYKSHPSAYHKSRILEDIIDQYKHLKINTSNNNIPNTDFNKG